MAAEVVMSGDVTINNAGATTISAGAIDNSKVISYSRNSRHKTCDDSHSGESIKFGNDSHLVLIQQAQ